METRDDAVAGLAEDLGRALLRFAARLRSSSPAIGPVEAGQQVPAPSPPATEAQAHDDNGTRGLGASQRRVLEAVQAAAEVSTTASEVAAASGLKSTNTPRMLKALAERGPISSWGSDPLNWCAGPLEGGGAPRERLRPRLGLSVGRGPESVSSRHCRPGPSVCPTQDVTWEAPSRRAPPSETSTVPHLNPSPQALLGSQPVRQLFGTSCPAGASDVVVVPRGPRPSPDAWVALVSGLPPLEQQRIGRVYQDDAQLDSAVGWSLLAELAARHGVSVWRNSLGRPVANLPVDLSMSHGGGWIAAAASRVGRVGVDVEASRPVSPALARRCLSAVEIVWLEFASGVGERQDRFVQVWTAKEAYLKAIGTGLGVDPRSITIDCSGPTPRLSGDVAGRWLFHSWVVAGDVRVALCEELPS